MSLEGRVVGLVEDDLLMGESLVQSLSLEGCHVDWWKTGREALRGLRATQPDLVVCDIRLPDIDGVNIFKELASTSSCPPFLFVTAFGEIDQAVSLIKAGAGDYLTKPFEIETFVDRARLLIQHHPTTKTTGTLGISASMRDLESTLIRMAALSSPLLVTGETGVGKEVCARFLHQLSCRSKEPFIAVNCAAIPGALMERELFGQKGSGPAGLGIHRGYAERARGGILFLDEVGELPFNLQAKLLRLVESREYNRVDGEQLLNFHGRIVCSTNANLAQQVEAKRFREDLYYRINGIRVEVPPLRERVDDIVWLMEHFVETEAAGPEPIAKCFSTLSLEAAVQYSWPGNVRELRNRVERAVALSPGDRIMPSDLFPEMESTSYEMLEAFATLSETREFAERRQIERALKQTNGQMSESARLLGVSRTTLWEKMRRLGIEQT